MRTRDRNRNSEPRHRYSLADWLAWQETLHPRSIDPGLERSAGVLARLGLEPPPGGVITVAGTNGKGSCVAFLDAVLRAAGRAPGAYTSPHLCRYNERVRMAGTPASDEALVAAFRQVDAARGDTSLTYFEFGTLAAMWLFAESRCDPWLLEVGLGGRLDAVNILDPDVAVVTSVGIDHVDWLGIDRDAIGAEKAGIFRKNKPAIIGDPEPPRGLIRHARALGADTRRIGRDFAHRAEGDVWSWQGRERRLEGLPRPSLAGEHQLGNAACALAALEGLADRPAVADRAIAEGLAAAELPGRFQVVPGTHEWVLDVAHNPAAAACLAANLTARPVAGDTHVVLGMLGDKDVEAFARALVPHAERWFAADLSGVDRGLGDRALAARLSGIADAMPAGTVAEACARADAVAVRGDRVLVCGSFHTVGAALRLRGLC